jgi:phosphoribosylanthranilate isomerase
MDRLILKVCGVRTPDGARACVQSAVDFAGLNFVPGRRRAVGIELARGLVAMLGPVRPVGVFVDATADEVVRVATAVGLRWVQLHGSEAPETCAQLRSAGLRVIKALPVDDDLAAAVARFQGAVDALLFDGAVAGSGRRWNWQRLEGVSRATPFLVAGGLTPSNVAQAVARLTPTGVDVASGVETDGQLDPERVQAFCATARLAALAVPAHARANWGGLQ